MRLIDADKMKEDLLTVDPQYETMIHWCITVLDAQPTVEPRHYHEENLLTYAHDMGVTLEQAKKELQKVTEQPQLDEWCDTCKEYDQERHCCPRFNRVIRETLDDVRKEAYKHGKSKGIKKGRAMAQRIKGRWIDCGYEENGDFKYHVWRCSECGDEIVEVGKPQENFCAMCGADMRETE